MSNNRIVIEFYKDKENMVNKFKDACYPVPLQVIGREIIKLFINSKGIQKIILDRLNRGSK